MFALLSVISGYPLTPTNLQCGVSACCLCKTAAEEQPEWMWQRGNASPLYRWVTLATVAISHNSGQRNTRHQLWHVWQPFDISNTEEKPPSCFYFLLSFFWGSVWIYDGELKWSGRKNYWCLSKYDSSIHSDCGKCQFECSKSFIICFEPCVDFSFLLPFLSLLII